jgi:hypothetical protein
MQPLRALIRDNRRLSLALLVMAFCFKALIPAGFMVTSTPDRVLTISICSGTMGPDQQMQVVIPGKDHTGGQSDAAQKGEPCAFGGMAHAAISGADAILLALAFAVILVLGLAPTARLPFREVLYLRPPLRGPPAAA